MPTNICSKIRTRDKIVSKPGFQFEKKKSDKGRQFKMCIVTDCSNLPPLCQIQSIFSKCDLDLGDIDVILSHDTPSNDSEQMNQVILKSNDK